MAAGDPCVGQRVQAEFSESSAGGKVIILDETLLKKTLKLYRPVSVFTDPRSLVAFASFSFPLQWPLVQQRILQELGSPPDAA